MPDDTKSPDDWKRIVAELRQRLGEDDRQTLEALAELARSYRDAGDFWASRPIEEELLARCQSVLGDEAPRTLNAMMNLALSYLRTGAPDKAQPLQETVIRFREMSFGPDHSAVIRDLCNLELMLGQQADFVGLEAVQERLVRSSRITLGDQDQRTLEAVARLAHTKRVLGRWDEALPLDIEARDGFTSLFGDCNEATLRARLACAMDLGAAERFAEAGELAAAVESDVKRALSLDNPLRHEILQATTAMQSMARRLADEE